MTAKLAIEAIGTFFLVLTIGLVVIEPGAGAMAPLAIGSVLMVMIYAGGHISGGHYNPAVTLGVMLRGKATASEMVGYWAAQVAGALVATLVVALLKDGATPVALVPDTVPALVAEFVFTFALVFVVLNVATAKGTAGNSYFGLAIGFTVLVGAYAVGGISGGAFNPAVSAGLVVMGLLDVGSVWVHLVAQLAAGAAAGLLFNALRLSDDKATTATPAEQASLSPAGSTR
jgi:aquaporin Z